jgi:hypothetical protein
MQSRCVGCKRFSLSVSWHRSSLFVPPQRSPAIETKEYDLVMAEFSADDKFPACGLKVCHGHSSNSGNSTLSPT